MDVSRLDKLNQPIFKRLYCCLTVCKKGFEGGCEPLIGLNGCHLKASLGGQLLVAVEKDGSDNIYHIAWVMIEVKIKDSWI